MRDFRDAKAMAQSLRAALAAMGLKITISQSLELIAKAFGVTDWNTLAAAVRREGFVPRKNNPRTPLQNAESAQASFSAELESTLHRARNYANQQKHEYTTLEHLLLALIDDLNALGVMRVCDVDVDALRDSLVSYIDNDLKTLVIDDPQNSKLTAAFKRVVRRAVLHAQGLGRKMATGGDVLVALFDEKESPAVWLLGEQEMTQEDAVNFILYGIVR
jgi:Glyoxalase superfamily protein/Clp amino terminal domain, pathogenicity island component